MGVGAGDFFRAAKNKCPPLEFFSRNFISHIFARRWVGILWWGVCSNKSS